MVMYGTELFVVIWYSMVCYGMVRYGVWWGMVGRVWCGMEWHGTVRNGMLDTYSTVLYRVRYCIQL